VVLYKHLKHIFYRKEKTLFIGAGSGLFSHENEVLDSYFPYKDLNYDEVIYFLSADYSKRLYSYKDFLKRNNVIIYSFVFSPFKTILSKIGYYLNKNRILKFINFFNLLRLKEVDVKISVLIKAHIKFIAGNLLYSVILWPLKISKVYVVSSYSNSDIIAVLKRRGIVVIEIQHGVVGETHRGYNYKVKKQNFPTPNKVYVYNDFWKKELLNAGYYSEEQIYIYGRLKYDLLAEDQAPVSEKYFVFTGQNCYSSEVVRFLIASDSLLIEQGIKLYYIPHPNETDKSLSDISNSLKNCYSVKIISNKNYTTEQYIFNSLAHISLFSSCHFDAIHYKGATFVANIIENNPMMFYVNSSPECFVKIKTIEEILAKINLL
jgi:hypothetical protein